MRLVLIVRIAGTPEDAPVIFGGESQRIFARHFQLCYLFADVVGKRCNRSHGILDLRRATIDGARHLNRARGRLSGGKLLAFVVDQEGLIIALYKRHSLVLGHVDGQGRREIARDCHRIDPVQSSNTGSCLARINA